MNVRISKSKFVAGCQCLKRLYLQVHQPKLAAEPDGAAEAIIEQGREVGMFSPARLFPGWNRSSPATVGWVRQFARQGSY